MVRQARIVLPGVAHHVTQRGTDRCDVFFSDEDRRAYLRYLRQSAVREGLALSAYCLMTDHVHLVATPEREDSLARALGRPLGSDEFLERIEPLLERTVRLKGVGRPQGSKDKKQRTRRKTKKVKQ